MYYKTHKKHKKEPFFIANWQVGLTSVDSIAITDYRLKISCPAMGTEFHSDILTFQTVPEIWQSDSVVTTCLAYFYDPGGPDEDYEIGSPLTMTFSPSDSGTAIKVVFDEFSLSHYPDNLKIYNGSSTSEELIATYTSLYTPIGETIFSTAEDGSLTFEFERSTTSYPRGSGWKALVSCYTPCVDYAEVILSSNLPLCEGDSLSLICTVDKEDCTFEWMGPGFTSTEQNPSISPVVSGHAGWYNVIVTTPDGCQTEEKIKVDINPGPGYIFFSHLSDNLCPGEELEIHAYAGLGLMHFTWYPEDFGEVTGERQDTIRARFFEAEQKIWCMVTNSFGCIRYSDTIQFFTDPVPTSLISVNPTDDTTKNGYIQFLGLIPAKEYIFNYIFEDVEYQSGLIISDLSGAVTLTGLGVGVYDQVHLTRATTSCRSKALYRVILGDSEPSIIEEETLSLFEVYPNPTHENLNIRFNEAVSLQAVIKIIDVYGKVLTEIQAEGQDLITIDIAHYPPGMYMLILQDQEENATIKFIKE